MPWTVQLYSMLRLYVAIVGHTNQLIIAKEEYNQSPGKARHHDHGINHGHLTVMALWKLANEPVAY